MRYRLLWFLLISLFIAILILIAQHGVGTVGPLSTEDFGSLAYKLAILVFLAAVVGTMFRERFTQAITAALLWVVVGLLLVIGYTYRFELGNVADRVLAELIPGHVISHGRTHAAPVTLDHITIGGLEERSVEALVVQPGQLRTSLLGMSFLNRLQSWQVIGDRLVLKGYP